MRHYLFYVFMLFQLLFCRVYAQQKTIPYQHEIDSLKPLFTSNSSPIEKAKVALDLSFYYSFSDSTLAHQQLKLGIQLSESSKLWSAIAQVYAGMFYMDYDLQQGLNRLRDAEQALAAFSDPQAYYYRARALGNLATIYQWQDLPLQTMDVLMNEALPASLLAKDEILIGNVYYNIGLNFWNNIAYQDAKKYLELAIKYLEKGKYDVRILEDSYKMLLLSCSSLGLMNEAKGILQRFERLAQRHPQDIQRSHVDYNRAVYFRFAKQYDAANLAIQQAISWLKNESKSNPAELSSLYYQSSLINFEKGDYQNALEALKLSENGATGRGSRYLQDSVNLALRYFQIYEKLGNYHESLEWSKKYIALKDTVTARKIRESILGYNLKYKSLEKEKEISTLKAERERDEIIWKTTQIIAAFVLAFSLIIGFTIYKYRQKNKRLKEQEEEQQKQKLQDELREQKLISLDAMLEGEEKERSRLSRDLHDGLGSVLASIKYKIQDIHPKEEDQKLNGVMQDMDYAIAEMRRISHNLMPESLRRFGLVPSLRDLCNGLQTTSCSIQLQLYGSLDHLSKDQQTQIYRIIQELLKNALHHAEPSHILLQMSTEEKGLLITVEDDGKGFDPMLLADHPEQGSGLKNVRTRVNYLEGKLDVQSSIGAGTSVNIELYL